jgi:hypothetical protein
MNKLLFLTYLVYRSYYCEGSDLFTHLKYQEGCAGLALLGIAGKWFMDSGTQPMVSRPTNPSI